MIKFIRIAVLLSALLISVAAYPREKLFQCTDSKSLMRKSMEAGFTYFATATDKNGFVIQLYINMRNGNWRIVGLDNKDHGCVMLNGVDWEFLRMRVL